MVWAALPQPTCSASPCCRPCWHGTSSLHHLPQQPRSAPAQHSTAQHSRLRHVTSAPAQQLSGTLERALSPARQCTVCCRGSTKSSSRQTVRAGSCCLLAVYMLLCGSFKHQALLCVCCSANTPTCTLWISSACGSDRSAGSASCTTLRLITRSQHLQ